MFSSKNQFLCQLNDQNDAFGDDPFKTPYKQSNHKYSKQKGTEKQQQEEDDEHDHFSQNKNYQNSQRIQSNIQSQNKNQYSSQNKTYENDEIQQSDKQQNDMFSQYQRERKQEAINKYIINYENDLYHILNISHTATQQQIKQQFRKLSLIYHPDKQQQARNNNQIQSQSNTTSFQDNQSQQDFVKILNAYNILSNERFRSIYDDQGYLAVQSIIDAENDI